MAVVARVYRCGECGGPNSEADRACSFCTAPIATLRCAHCYHLNIPENRNCSACGEVLGLVPASVPTAVLCPECGTPCACLEGNPGHLFDCSGCGGQFVEHKLLSDLLERRRRFRSLGPTARANPLDRKVRYIKCPLCQHVMLGRNFGRVSGIIVDCCTAHGVWFEHGELTRVLAFVEAGGLAESRRHQLGLPTPIGIAAQDNTARAVASSPEQARARRSEPSPLGTAAGVALGVAESTLDLLALLGEFIVGER